MRTYTVKEGDTLALISRLQYGTPNFEANILEANPSISEPLVIGQVLNIPDKQNQVQIELPSAPAEDQNQISIAIDNQLFTFFEDVSISRQIDSIDSFSFTAPFEPSNQNIRNTFKPFTYKKVQIFVGENPEFTGTMFVSPQLDDVRTMGISGYALPGVLNDCNASLSAYPIEFNNQTLKEISDSLLKPFGLNSVFLSDVGDVFIADPLNPFERVAPKEEEKILAFLANLANQRNQVMTNNEFGDLVYQVSTTIGNPVARLTDGSSPLLSVTPTFNEQDFYSSVSGISPSNIGDSGQSYTVNNPFLKGIFRPFTFKANDTDDSTLKAAVEYKAALMFANAITYEITVNTWRDNFGNLWKPNTTIVLNSPNSMIYSDYEFLIRGVNFGRGVIGDTAVLSLVLPGAFSGILPRSLPWD